MGIAILCLGIIADCICATKWAKCEEWREPFFNGMSLGFYTSAVIILLVV